MAQVDTDQVLDVLAPIWSTTPVTATRVRNRIELILDAAKARQLRTGENPARWRGHLDKLLPRHKRSTLPFPALPAEQVPALLHRLDRMPGPAARACELLILTATRSGEVCGARWEEFDLAARIWTIPAHRMKAKRAHRVPLTEAMLEVLEQVQGNHQDFVFLNARRTGPSRATPCAACSMPPGPRIACPTASARPSGPGPPSRPTIRARSARWRWRTHWRARWRRPTTAATCWTSAGG
ncbi:tyrosine-type recombinase/integrase [Azotobacter chroococcum]